ncbi:hypothetical protein D9756_001623 [Leucocoprinus leucothites]|uniref:Uncharacterized protein n=1 Tax=Leucocoprinus leucothites TaxID=201217 RepID=A0A8H5G4H9_9AGAR|nr:hypothetical protein D9756_001623 [Leucoagaricus leucothites]
MPFATATHWPEGLRSIFELSRQQREVFPNRYYAPYLNLLSYCFNDAFEYFVTPYITRIDNETPHDLVDPLISLVVFNAKNRPVVFADIKEDWWQHNAYYREVEDFQLRRRLDLVLDSPLPRIYGLSLFGTSLRVYTANSEGEKQPSIQPRPNDNDHTLPRDYLEGAWDIDILSQDGFNKMKEIVEDVVTDSDAFMVPFTTSTCWPRGLLSIFCACREYRETVENRYTGPFFELLNYCFADEFKYIVAPYAPLRDCTTDDAVDPIILLVVYDAQYRPLLFLEVKDDIWAEVPQSREIADRIVRRRFDCIGGCPRARLWGLSLLGTCLRVYSLDMATGRILPSFDPRPDSIHNILSGDPLPLWDIDILSQTGFEKMKEIVNSIVNHGSSL